MLSEQTPEPTLFQRVQATDAYLEARLLRFRQNVFERLFPEKTSTWFDGSVYHSRHLYPRHMELFRMGATYRERCFRAANRVGKTFSGGGYEMACHLTGKYPDWWEGRRFNQPIRAWAAGTNNESTRDIVQFTLLGEVGGRDGFKNVMGTGVIPGRFLGRPKWKSGVQDLVDTITVRHESGGWSHLGFKSYEQGRVSFEGTAKHFIWLDEEPPLEVYNECVIRTATTNGLVMLTFTPLQGYSATVKQFMVTGGNT